MGGKQKKSRSFLIDSVGPYKPIIRCRFDSNFAKLCQTLPNFVLAMPSLPVLYVLIRMYVLYVCLEACSSRSTPKPRPPSPTTRPNITFQTYACPEAYAKWYCLNGATCFSVRIGESILYNCEYVYAIPLTVHAIQQTVYIFV